MKHKPVLKVAIVLLFASAFLAFYLLGGAEYLNLATIKQQQSVLFDAFNENTVLFTSLFFILYVISAAFSLPIAALLTLLGGAIFGFIYGLILVSFASSIGATIAFLMSRFILKETIQSRYAEKLQSINKGIEKEGNFYLFALRLVPVFPFFLVNLVMGLMPISARNFYIVSQLGMLPGTGVFVYAGTELGKINSLSDITSPTLLLSFALLGLFPLIAKKALALFRKNSLHQEQENTNDG